MGSSLYLAAACAAVGFLIGALVGSVRAADTANAERKEYEDAYAVCMRLRGYEVRPP